MDPRLGTEHYYFLKIEKRKLYTLILHKHSMQFIRGNRSLNFLVNSDSQSLFLKSLLICVFNSLEIFAVHEDPMNWGNEKMYKGCWSTLTFNF